MSPCGILTAHGPCPLFFVIGFIRLGYAFASCLSIFSYQLSYHLSLSLHWSPNAVFLLKRSHPFVKCKLVMFGLPCSISKQALDPGPPSILDLSQIFVGSVLPSFHGSEAQAPWKCGKETCLQDAWQAWHSGQSWRKPGCWCGPSTWPWWSQCSEHPTDPRWAVGGVLRLLCLESCSWSPRSPNALWICSGVFPYHLQWHW